MLSERLIDLDELILRCRDKTSKAYIAEAVACYRAGAFRSCIVATWIAVVFDFLSKLNELELTGDGNAREKRAWFNEIREQHNISESLKFERDVLSMAKNDFEFITPVEYLDFQRLWEDRNRCAHPSMNSEDEVYQPTAELARYHLHNAVVHMLQHRPVQGKAALERLMQDVSSDYFPTDTDKAIEYLSEGPLSRPRDALVCNFTIVLVKFLLRETHQGTGYQRHAVALAAVCRLPHTKHLVEDTMKEKLNGIVRNLNDNQLVNLLFFLRDFQQYTVWGFLDNDVQIKIKTLIENQSVSNFADVFSWFLDFKPLQEQIKEKITKLTEDELAMVIGRNPRIEYSGRALQLYAKAESYKQANSLADKLILPLVQFFNEEHIELLFKEASQNNQIYSSYSFREVQSTLLKSSFVLHDIIIRIVLKYYVVSNLGFQSKIIQTIQFIQLEEDEMVSFLDDLLENTEQPDRKDRLTIRINLRDLAENGVIQESTIEMLIQKHFPQTTQDEDEIPF